MTPRERPILFSGAMVRAILAGAKTQTRRVVKPQAGADSRLVRGESSPFGVPGDQLWVREAWRLPGGLDDKNMSTIRAQSFQPAFAPTWAPVEYIATNDRRNWTNVHWGLEAGRYRHARFMPRWASRLTLEVTGVRVERVQAISVADIAAEGVTTESVTDLWNAATKKARRSVGLAADCGLMPEYLVRREPQTPRDLWRIGWTLINGRPSWDANPWVWVVSFRRVDG